MTRRFVHLHVHTEYSLLDGAIRCGDLAAKAVEFGMPAVAMTDHGAMYGTVEFYDKCTAAGIKPIIGCEVYVDPDGHTSREKRGKNHHLILLAENNEGYRNLVKLCSIAYTDGFYSKPRIDHALLAQYKNGLIVSSACLAGEIPSLILEGREQEALERAFLYRDIVGKENFFLEVMYNAIPEQAVANKALIRMAREHGFPLIATNDAHYLLKEDYDWHEILLCVQTKSSLDDENRMSFSSNDFYLRSPEEMDSIFGAELPDALDNTVAIAERCHVTLPLGERDYKLPRLDLPEGETLESNLEKEAIIGLGERVGDPVPEEYRQRLDFEIGVINSMGFAGYFLIVAGIIKAAKKRGIPIGPGRGSAAGSLVAWSLKITELDPIKYNLLFERFLNPERISMPDIDTDVSDKGRDELLHYITEKYGHDKVSQIVTFGRLKSRAAVTDVGRVLGMPVRDVVAITRLIPPMGIHSIGEAVEQVPELAELKKSNPMVARVLDVASNIEGLARHCSQHAAGVVITPVPITDLVPVRRIGQDQIVTQYPMEPIEKLGLVKMDFLGLRTLSVIEEALQNISLGGKSLPDIEHIPLDDRKTYEMLQKADTLGVFQLESTGMRQLLKKLQVDCFEDLIAVLAMYRPGPLGSGMVDQYIECKHGRATVKYLHPLLEGVLRETYGVVLYQEQVMQCAAILAGYSLGEADLLRRAMGKKKADVMEQQRAKFVEGCTQRNINEKSAQEIFDIIQEFAGYGFNKSHSAAYALITYQTAWLKANYRSEFMAAYLSSQIGSKKEDLAAYVREVRNSGIDVLPPDVNSSMASFTPVGEVVRFGLGAVAKAGHTAVEAILAARNTGTSFLSMWDFLCRVDLRVVNKAVVENLVRAGAFDNLGNNRRKLLEGLPELISAAQKKCANSNQCSLFDSLPEEDAAGPDLPDVSDFTLLERLEMEKDAVGLYISGHPFEQYEKKVRMLSNCTIAEVRSWRSKRIPPLVGGLVLSVKERTTKNGDPMGIVEIEDAESRIEAVCFPRTWEPLRGTIQPGRVCLVSGFPEERGDTNIIAKSITLLDEDDGRNGTTSFVRISVLADFLQNVSFKDFIRALKACPGKSPVLLELRNDSESTVLYLQDIKVDGRGGITPLLSEVIPEELFQIG
ncbi:MAG: DNA polymerase III subunit alpha [Synergistetes bacterium HGW-Synergistetes-2]|nr:MAG: DNA polymerase III subunit alpha [Synergistetes bacterium HGW-Synergistetes-2]